MDPDKSLVCEACRNGLFSFVPFQIALASRTLYDGFSYSTAWKDVQKSALGGCKWCMLLLSVKDETMPGDKVRVTVGFRMQSEMHTGTMLEDRKTLRLGINGRPNCVFYTYTTEDDPAAPYITTRDLVRRVSSQSSYKKALECIEHCIFHHPECPKPQQSTLPTRVIDCTDPAKPKIFITNGAVGLYVALSYVWGESQPCTTTENIDTRANGLAPEDLPKTIQDAITATHGYGLRYLWVDALCILQDSQADKDREIAEMRRIYRDAHLTITAASARKVSEGFLQDRQDFTEDTRVPYLCPDRKVGSIWLSPVWKQHDEALEPVNSRAWCLQERMLSARSLIYASHTLQYACQTETVNIGRAVCSPISGKRLPKAVFGIQPSGTGSNASTLSKHEMDEARRSWKYILEDYSQRNITEPADKLIAMSGVAEQFHLVWDGSEYLAGLWRHMLLQDLLWFKNYERRLPRPARYCAPSWSWAAVDGHVIAGTSADDSRLDAARYELGECEVVGCSVTLSSGVVPFGAVVGGVLRLRARLVKAFWNPAAEMPDLFVVRDDMRACIGNSYPDSNENEAVEEVWAVPMRWNTEEAYAVGLLVVPSEERGLEKQFRRVGYFHSAEGSKDLMWMESEELVMVIT
ncbi:hypothetical protein GALMADRAFT_136513 [Galerina marginata CBS 339.88]|uniref:Heterokaryon incompatibility domain-containing protein n=1 Tax=Galerina marginata (strain CBS 339.88) TaxID=685588 RepID=A0A067TA13_GALM3|nr:hypothetical protein GALMADRAFT_136513 [Galerina marginata CBS 339.88]